MLIPSIDLMNGQVVQLEQGRTVALASDDLNGWISRFARFPIVQVVDLDAALRKGDNAALVRHVCASLPCQVGGGIRSIEHARATLEAGARRVIIGSALFGSHGINLDFVTRLAAGIGRDAIVAAIDAGDGRVLTHGWTQSSGISPEDAMRALQPHVGGFLYTDVEREGLLGGFNVAVAARLKEATTRDLTVAGGIRSQQEIDELDRLGIDAVVGMAVYRGLIDVGG